MGSTSEHQRDGQSAKTSRTPEWRLNGSRIVVVLLNLALWGAILTGLVLWLRPGR